MKFWAGMSEITPEMRAAMEAGAKRRAQAEASIAASTFFRDELERTYADGDWYWMFRALADLERRVGELESEHLPAYAGHEPKATEEG